MAASGGDGMNGMAVIRGAGADDAAGIARVQVACWRSTYPGLLPDQFLVGLSAETIAARWRRILLHYGARLRTFVVVEDAADDGRGEVVGFGTCGRQRSRLAGYGGEVYALYVHDAAQGRGLGRRLMATMAAALMLRGHGAAVVWVLDGNPSRWFYEHLGGVQMARRTISFAGASVPEVAYGWRDLTALARMRVDRTVG